MPELDERHRLLRQRCREWAADLRPHALALDRDPALVTRLLHLPAVSWSARLQIPAAHNPTPLVVGGERFHLTSVLERTVFCEEMARADLGMMLALPGGSMSGVLVDAVGDEAQREWFYGRLLAAPTWTFFALTEPGGGSDAAAMGTRLVAGAGADGDEFVLSGAKRYVSNAVRAAFGVVFYRTGPGPLGIGAALVEAAAPGFHVAPIETIGVRGAQLGAITLDAVRVRPEQILGRGLPPTRRGAAGWLRTLSRLRPTVAAMAVGLAQAAHDYAREHRRAPGREDRDRLAELDRRIESVRRLTRAAALAADHGRDRAQLAAAAKLRGVRLAEEASRTALDLFGPGARLEHPLLDKMARDARGLEFMEGTGDIQRLSLFTALATGALERELSGCRLPV